MDEDGQAHVKAGFPADLRAPYERVADKGLLVSLVDEAQVGQMATHLNSRCQRAPRSCPTCVSR